MASFIISTDNSADFFKSDMEKKGIYCVPLKRILENQTFTEIYDSDEEYDAFYKELDQGHLSTTSPVTPEQFEKHFAKILAAHKTGDIIHVPLSSNMSECYKNAVETAAKMNPTLKNRKIYVFDSLTCTSGINMLLDRLMEMRETTPAERALIILEGLRDTQQLFFIVDDLAHLVRGGRLKASKAFIGSLMGIKPILIMNRKGWPTVETSVKGSRKALKFLVKQTEKRAENKKETYDGKPIYLMRTNDTEQYTELKKLVEKKYPKAIIKENKIGPIIGTHTGSGTVGILFQGKARLDV